MVIPALASAAVVASEDFDGGAVNLISSSVTNLDGGGGDWFGVGNWGAWPQATGVPFSLADDSVVGVSGGGVFPADDECVFGQNKSPNDNWFGLADTREWTPEQLTASWKFNIHGYTGLFFDVDFGGISNASFGGFNLVDTKIVFTAQIDGGAEVQLMEITAVDLASTGGFVTRLNDAGAPTGGGAVLVVNGPNAITKLLAETGLPAANQYVDKTDPATGRLDTYHTLIPGIGDEIIIKLYAAMPFEAAAFDNLVITGDVSTPSNKTTWGGLKNRYR